MSTSPAPCAPWSGSRSRGAPWVVAALAAALGCGRSPAPDGPELDNRLAQRHATGARPPADAGAGSETGPDTGPKIDRPAMVRFHMQRHFDDLRTIERRLVSGKLAEAKALAYLLSQPAPDPGFAPWSDASARLVEAAVALASSPNLAEAYRREPRVAAACAHCHLDTRRVPVFPPPPAPPPDLGTREARMARHQWAVDRLWEAMVGASEPAWRAGLDVLAATPSPGDRADLARQLQELAKRQRAAPAASLEARADGYGEILVTCGACHAPSEPAR